MSNTSSVSPYESTGAVLATASEVGASVGSGLAALVGWLCEETAEDRAVLAAYQEQRRRERFSTPPSALTAPVVRREPMSVRSVPLKLKNADSLVRSAEKLGYRLMPLAGPLTPLAETGAVLLRHADGRRLALRRNRDGRIQVETAGTPDQVDRLVHQHSFDQTTSVLAKQGMETQAVRLRTGETQILASERGTKPDGNAVVRVQVQTDGKLDVDVDCVRGGRCQRIVDGIAEAIGGEVTATSRKSSFYEEPGEPTRPKIKV